jgi:hypothetical protein
MRLWTIHPRYLDRQGLLAAWREGLLAQKVLSGLTRGYRHHPQLIRFQAHRRPAAAIATFLHAIAIEAEARGYRFNASKISQERCRLQIRETLGQLDYEWMHLKAKLRRRSPLVYKRACRITRPEPHPLFIIVPGEIRSWEKRQ